MLFSHPGALQRALLTVLQYTRKCALERLFHLQWQYLTIPRLNLTNPICTDVIQRDMFQ